jgi:O-antigen ligase
MRIRLRNSSDGGGGWFGAAAGRDRGYPVKDPAAVGRRAGAGRGRAATGTGRGAILVPSWAREEWHLTQIILVAGLALVVAVAYAMRRPAWRLPALAFALLSVPGNVDNLGPQILLDPHDIASNTAPVVSFVDLLIVWGLWLSLPRLGAALEGSSVRVVLAAAMGLFATGAAVTMVNAAQGVELGPTLRSILFFARVPAILAIALATGDELGRGRRLALAVALGLVSLIANGLYTSTQAELTRFTAATFGRNGLSLALMIGVLAAAGAAVAYLRDAEQHRDRRSMALGVVAVALACSGLFAAIATGTRMSILTAVPVFALALAINRTWLSGRGIRALGLAAVLVILTAGASVLWTPEGGRAISGLTDPGNTIDIVTNPEDSPWYEPVRTRSHWWGQARQMIAADPLTGVGGWQWNHERYLLEPDAIVIVADPHNTYLQLAAEHGLVVAAAYAAVLGAVLLIGAVSSWHARSPVSSSWPATMLASAAVLAPITEMTNSHFFNARMGAVNWVLLGALLAWSLGALPAAIVAIRSAVSTRFGRTGRHVASTR